MASDGAHPSTSSVRHSRRALAGYSLAAAALLASRAIPADAGTPAPADLPVVRTWLLATPDELRPPAPGTPTSIERAEVLQFQSRRTAQTIATVEKWAIDPPILPWTSLALDLIRAHPMSPTRAARALALLHAALHDTVVAVHDARAAYPRQTPWQVDTQVTPLATPGPADASFPSEHAAIAAAAVAVLAHVFPDEPSDGFARLTEEAAESRLWAGGAFRSDIDAGLVMGQEVGERAIDRARADGASAVWDGRGRPVSEDAWQPLPQGSSSPRSTRLPARGAHGSFPAVMPTDRHRRQQVGPRPGAQNCCPCRKRSPAARTNRRRLCASGLAAPELRRRPGSGSRLPET